MLRTNEHLLPVISVQSYITEPVVMPMGDAEIGDHGKAHAIPGMGGICYNFQIGDCCMGLCGEHIEAGVSSKNAKLNANRNRGTNSHACVGNRVKIQSGEAKGRWGWVTGTHGGAEHVFLHFDPETLDMLCMDDSFLIKSVGYGLKLLDYPDVMPLAIDPWLLHAMNIEEKDGKLIIPVAKKVPACLMGSGIGRMEPGFTGDADIITTDRELTEQYGLNELRFGDIVLIEDFDSSWGRGYCKGAVTIGCIIHGDTYCSGHGPGVTSLLTCKTPIIEGKIDEKANLAYLFGVKE